MKKGFTPGLATLLSAAFVFAMPSQASAATDFPVLDFGNMDVSTSNGSVTPSGITGTIPATSATIAEQATKTTAKPNAHADGAFTVLRPTMLSFNWTSSTNKAPTSGLGYTMTFIDNGVSTALTTATGSFAAFQANVGDVLEFNLANTGKTNSIATASFTFTPASIRAPEIDGGKLPLAFLLLGMLFVASRRKLFSKTFSA